MSAISNVRLKECKVKLTRLTKEEIEKYTGKTYEKAKKITDLFTEVKPKIYVRTDIHTDDIVDTKTTQDIEDTSNTDHEIMPDIIEPQNIQNDGINNEEINETQDIEDTSNTDHEIMPDIIEPQNIQNGGINNEKINETQDIEDTSNTDHEIMPDIIEPQNIQNDGINNEEINETQDIEDTSNTDHEIMPDIIEPQNIQNDGINNEEINETHEEDNMDNMFAGFNDFMPNMIYQQYDQNDMDTSEGNENIYNPQNDYIPNHIMIKQEVPDDSYDTYMPQSAGSSQIMIKQEVVDESYNYNNIFSTQGSHNMYNEYIMPNMLSNQPTQNFGMQSINPGTSNPHVTIKQEVFDEGNIEVFTQSEVENNNIGKVKSRGCNCDGMY